MIATTLYKDLLIDSMLKIDSDELELSLLAPARPANVSDATAILMRRARSATDFHGRKVFPYLIRDQNIYNDILR
jgi:hypothetical protein